MAKGLLEMIFEEKFKDYKSLYLCVSGGADSAIGLYLVTKYIVDNNLDHKMTIVTGVEPQPEYCRNDKNAKKVVSIIQELFPTANIDKHLITFLEGYVRRRDDQPQKFPKYARMKQWHNNNWKKGDYDLGISFCSSFPKKEDLMLPENEALYKKSLTIGPEDRSWTGKENDKIRGNPNRGGMWWEPFLNTTKKELADYYYEHKLMDNLFPYTGSCTGDAKHTDNFTKPCQVCFWCLEKYWAFGMFDYPQAYKL